MPLVNDFKSFNFESLGKIQKSLISPSLQVVINRPWTSILAFIIGLSLRWIVQKLRRRSIAYLRGPPSGPWLIGNLPELLAADEAAVNAFKWTKEYGTALTIRGAMGVQVLHITDPRALHYVLNTTGYNSPKTQQTRATTRVIMGEGLVYAQGDQHTRQRKLMNPAFSPSVFPGFFEQFQLNISKTIEIWKKMIARSDGKSCVIDVPTWISRTTLAIIGQVGFNYDFGTLDDIKNPLAEAYKDLFVNTTYKRSNGTLVFEALWGQLPFWMVKLMQRLPIGRLKRYQDYRRVASKVAKDMIKVQTELYRAGNERGRDMLSILIRANLSGDPSVKISDYEIESQLTTLMLAGHDTTGASIIWGLYELSRHQYFQRRIREEIVHVRSRMSERGDSMLTTTDLETMKYLAAFIKEVNRFHPIIPLIIRESRHDDVLPLSHPVQTRDGRYIESIPISKGQRIVISIAAYNRLKSVWGDDAETFRPDRFLDESKQEHKIGVGVTSNILFEMQIIFMELLEHFNFSPDPSHEEIFRAATSIMTPMRKSNPGEN
ncbi:hypothetical protein Clacol_010154 [Clathrus columnatus]|uniref:Cytochrome P450 n=1 Tax=Clathrus columnatus TaxID=1419009 RepID=A0AAV5AU96_9AGAM|nr:hypothetical protein Clacol_010154 [Clathrus columnatus]